MEWWLEKLIIILPMLALGAWTVYVQRTQAAEKKREAEEKRHQLQEQHATGVTSNILADGTSIRRELVDQLKDERARSDKFESWIEALRSEVNDLKSKVNNLSFLKFTLENENEELKVENARLHDTVENLTARVVHLEAQVKEFGENQV